MNFNPIPCHEALQPFIRNYWVLSAQCTATGTQQIFSNGAASLQFYLNQPIRVNGSEQLYRTILLSQNMGSVGITCEEGAFIIFGAEFVPFCSRVFFRKELKGEYTTPEEMQDEDFAEVCRKIYEADNNEQRTDLLDNFFMKRLSEFPSDDVNMERLNNVFDKMSEENTPSDLASTACLSQKQFTRVFNKYVGMNPKAYLRLQRFHKALMELQNGFSAQGGKEGASLTDIAWRCGYYDLAHMVSDFRDICGYSPRELLNQGTELTETFGHKFSGLMKKKIKIENLI